MRLYNRLYSYIKKKHLEKAMAIFAKIDMKTVYDIITKNCWEYGIQYILLMKTPFVLEVGIIGRRDRVLIKFHKTQKVYSYDMISFREFFLASDYTRAYYITTGSFHKEHKEGSWNLSFLGRRQVKTISSKDFLIRQEWMTQPYYSHFKYKKLDFYPYLPY